MKSSKPSRHIRHENDAYYTPDWVTTLVIPFVPELANRTAVVLDPAAGRGDLLKALRAGGAVCGFEALEIDGDAAKACSEHSAWCLQRDALTSEPWASPPNPQPGAVVMNPPFSHAERFARRALAEVKHGGTVAAFLRLAFLESEERSAFLREWAPDVRVLWRRPSFTGDGKTDGTAYAWMIWRAGMPRSEGVVSVLDCPPAPPRQARKAAPAPAAPAAPEQPMDNLRALMARLQAAVKS